MHTKLRHFNMNYFKSYFSAILPCCAQELIVSETLPSTSATIKSMSLYLHYVNWKHFGVHSMREHSLVLKR